MSSKNSYLPEPDTLFDLADAVQALIGRPLTIEDERHRLLAYSADQLDVDQARIDTILRRRAPKAVANVDERSGSMRRLRRAKGPIFFDPAEVGKDGLPRVAIAIRAGEEVFGTIWVVSREPLGPEKDAWLIEGARIAAEHLVGRSTAARPTRSDDAAMRDLLSGGDRAVAVAATLGLPEGPLVVLALGLDQYPRADRAKLLSERRRTLDAFSVHLGTHYTGIATGTVDGQMLAVIPGIEADRLTDIEESCRYFTEHRLGQGLRIALADPVPGVEHLRDAAEEVGRALRVIADEVTPRVVRTGEVGLELMLTELQDLLSARGAEPFGAYAVLHTTDEERGTDLLGTIRVWLDCHGDVPTAAARMHLHHNTLRYRLNRVTEVHGIDLADPRTRLALDLQLRLFRDPSQKQIVSTR